MLVYNPWQFAVSGTTSLPDETVELMEHFKDKLKLSDRPIAEYGVELILNALHILVQRHIRFGWKPQRLEKHASLGLDSRYCKPTSVKELKEYNRQRTQRMPKFDPCV